MTNVLEMDVVTSRHVIQFKFQGPNHISGRIEVKNRQISYTGRPRL